MGDNELNASTDIIRVRAAVDVVQSYMEVKKMEPGDDLTLLPIAESTITKAWEYLGKVFDAGMKK